MPDVRVRVWLYGTLRRFSQPGTPGLWQGEVPEGTRIADLLGHIGADRREVSAATINGMICGLDAEIPDSAEIVLVTPMGGGRTSHRRTQGE